MSPEIPRENPTNAQYRTLEALEADGILLYMDKGGTLYHLKQPRMDCYAVRVVKHHEHKLVDAGSEIG